MIRLCHVHFTHACSDGIGRTGAFMTIYSQMEKAKSEGVVDLFQFVSRARKQRSGVVRNKVSFEINSMPRA